MTTIQEPQSADNDHNRSTVARTKEPKEVAARVGDALDSATSSVGRGMDRAGAMLETTGKSAGASVRDAGNYFQESDPAKMRVDFMATLGRHPGATLAIGIGAGLLIGRIYRSHR